MIEFGDYVCEGQTTIYDFLDKPEDDFSKYMNAPVGEEEENAREYR